MVCPGVLYLELHGGSCTVVQNSFGASSLHFMVFDGNNAARQKIVMVQDLPHGL